MSKNTVKLYIDKYHGFKTPWEILAVLNNHKLDWPFHTFYATAVSDKIHQLYDHYPEMDRQLRKRGVTVAMLFRRFKEQHLDSLGETFFYQYWRLWKKRESPSKHIV